MTRQTEKFDLDGLGISKQELLAIFADEAWLWFDANQNERLWTMKVWIFKRVIYVRDLYPFFKWFFGPPPGLGDISDNTPIGDIIL